jgi:parvulin-like peptidyl-prolyl cis-trans isomerase-like protein/PPIC-type peptidyl-prolyl cis-trans isomerase-like protein
MRKGSVAPPLIIAVVAASGPLFAAAPKSSVYALVQGPNGVVKASLFNPADGTLPIAKVGGRTVILSELTDAIGTWHQANVKVERKARSKDFTEILDRLIGVRLIVQEAEAMGMEDLDAAKTALQEYPETALREQLQRIALKGVKADAAEAQRLYRDKVREWKLESALFEKEEDAKALVAAAKSGKPFHALVQKAVEEKKAKGGAAPAFFNRDRMLAQVTVAVQQLKVGEVSEPIQVGTGFAVVRVEGERFPENARVRAETQQQALSAAKARAIATYYKALLKKYVKVDEKLLASLDFEAKEPGFKALEKDQRVVAAVEGGKPITVADIAEEVKVAFFHGVEQAIQSKKVNNKKADFLDVLMSRQVVALEAARLKLAETPEYKKAIAAHRDQLLFAAFTSRVVVPDLKITENDLQKYYEAHKSEFTYPAFYRLRSLAFFSHKAAQSTLEKLKAGTDFKWLQQNADDQVPVDQRAIELDGNVVSGNALLPEVAKAIAGAKSGDLRVAEYKGQHFVIVVSQVTPPTPQPFAEAREAIAPKVQAEVFQKALEDWVAKLRKAHDVKVYITKIVS